MRDIFLEFYWDTVLAIHLTTYPPKGLKWEYSC